MNVTGNRLICPLQSITSQLDNLCFAEACAWFNKETGICAMAALGTLRDTLAGWDESTIPVFHVRSLKDNEVIVGGHIETRSETNEG